MGKSVPRRLTANELLPHFTRLVEGIERGHHPPCFADRTEAIQALVGEICIAPWQTAEERDKAQGLVNRLVRLSWQDKTTADGEVA